MTDGFINLHNHSDYSLLDGFGTIDEYIAKAVEFGQPALGLTDHGNICGLHMFIESCHKAGIKAIPGIEAYIAPVNPDGARAHRPIRYGMPGQESIDVSGNGAYLHMTLFAMNNDGMKSLYKLVREASLEGNEYSHLDLPAGEGNFYMKPRIDFDMLAKYNNGLIATSGCPSGEIQTRFRLGQDEEAYDYARRMKELFDGRYFIEIMDHSMKNNDIESSVIPKLLKLSEDLDIPLLATNDSHYCNKEDAIHHEEMLCANSKAKMTDKPSDEGGNRFAFNGHEYYLKTSDDMLAIPVFAEHPEAVANTVRLADMVEDITFSLESDLRPEVKIPAGFDEVGWFKHKIKEGFKKKRIDAGASKELLEESQKRIAHELPVFTKNNFAQYMLVVQDYINWARNNGIGVGFGRGCFLPGMKVKNSNGIMTNIENINVGIKAQTHDTSYHRVEDKFQYDVRDEDCVEIELSNGSIIKCTADHMIFSKDNGFIKAEDLSEGNIILGPKGRKELSKIKCDSCGKIVKTNKYNYDRIVKKGIYKPVGEYWCNECANKNTHLIPSVQEGSIRGSLRNKEPDVKAKNAVSLTEYWKNNRDEHINKIREHWENNPESYKKFRENCRKRNLKRYSDPIELDKLSRQGRGNYKSGIFHSYQNNIDIYYASSYELKALNIFETDSEIIYFDRCKDSIEYISPDDNNIHKYLPDFYVEYKNGLKKVIEIKAEWQTHENRTIAKINAAYEYYEGTGIQYEVWTEKELEDRNDAWHNEFIVKSIKHFKYTGKVYDLQVEGVHNYVINGVTVHNSVGGSEIAYLMNISDTDPIRHDLMFERFLNPERLSPPDVDTDFAASRRDEVVEYVKEKYGESHIANIITFNKFLSKTALNDMARIYGVSIADTNRAAKLMPEAKAGAAAPFKDIYTPGSEFYDAAAEFRELMEEPEWKPVIAAARAIEGRIKTTGVHACGLIMSSHDITDAAPFIYKHAPTKPWGASCCQWTYPELEEIGLIKMDFLSLSDLDIVSDTLANIRHTHDGKAPDMSELVHGPMDDNDTYAMLSRGDTLSCFQISSEGMKSLFKRMHPSKFEDIAASVALYRPGPMGMDAHVKYADRAAGKEPVYVVDENLDKAFHGTAVDKILSTTEGLCIPADTQILDGTTGKFIAISDFNVGSTTPSMQADGEYYPSKVISKIHTGTKACVRITTTNNRSLEVSETHPVLTQRGWVPAGEITSSDFMAAANGSSMIESNAGNASKFTADEAYLIGAMIGDGSMTGDSEPYITNASEDFFNIIRDAASSAFDSIDCIVSWPNHKNNVKHLYFMNSDRKPQGKYDRDGLRGADRNQMNQVLARAGFEGKVLMYDKEITPELWSCDNGTLLHVIGGMWDTDGAVSDNVISYTTTSKKLFSSMELLLQRLGIMFSIEEQPYENANRANRTAYRIFIPRDEFITRIAPYTRLKKAKALSLPARSIRKNVGCLVDNVYNDIMRTTGLDSRNEVLRMLAEKTGEPVLDRNRSESVVLQAMRAGVLTDECKAMCKQTWVRVASVESIGMKDCYDLEVDGSHNLVVNGFTVHNCTYQEQVMNISRLMSGFSWGDADALRKGMGHKQIDVLNAMEPKFIEGAVENGYPKKEVEELWSYLKVFGQYGFNKCLHGRTLVCMCIDDGNGNIDYKKARIEDIYREHESGVPLNLKVLAMYPDGSIRPAKVKSITRMPDKMVTYEIRTESGKYINITSNHRLLTTDGYGTIDDGGLAVGNELMIDDNWNARIPAETKETRKKNAAVAARSENGRESSRQHMVAYQSTLTYDDRSAHQKAVQELHPHRTDAAVKAMCDRVAWLRENDEAWNNKYNENLRKNLIDRVSGYGIRTALSDGRICDSLVEAAAGEYLLARGVDFELHKEIMHAVSANPKFCDFYANGIYFEMDGLHRGRQYFIDNKYGTDIPFVYMTPFDYKDVIDEALITYHVSNGDMIVSIKPTKVLDSGKYMKETVYDIEMEDDGPANFIANGIVSHNSHAVSYGIITYETAYLKCHYPAEFMAAILTDKIRKAKDVDDVKNAIREVREIGLKVGALDIDSSDVGVSAVKKTKKDDPDIVFGISGIKGISPNFARKFVDDRNRNHPQPYESVDEFMRSLPAELISKKLLDGLAGAGAFDKFGVSRRAMVTVLPELLEYYKNEAKQKEAGKESLFDDWGDEDDEDNAGISTFVIPNIRDWDWITRLEQEEKRLGVFVSGHPMSNIGDGLKFLQRGYANSGDDYGSIRTVDEAAHMKIPSRTTAAGRSIYSRVPVRIIASIADIVEKRTKTGKPVLMGVIESETDSIPFTINRDSMDSIYSSFKAGTGIVKNHVYMITGRLSIDWNGNHSVNVDAFDEVILDESGRAPIWIQLRDRNVKNPDSPGYKKLMAILDNRKYAGDIPVYIHVRNADGTFDEINTGRTVACSDEFMLRMEKFIGASRFGRWPKNKE